MSRTQQDLFQLPAKRRRHPRAVTQLQDNSGIQLDKGAQDQFGRGLNRTVTRARVEATLGDLNLAAQRALETPTVSYLFSTEVWKNAKELWTLTEADLACAEDEANAL
ncbi:unnamed protein product [Pleuronectes platessa]|uniref:Uncharacterized protein n=1 Tax=Pleuronectes platessa TaxID=8262 RepID=A0A9N7V299_PLEPL|nr:unnamed protein product [Pleuronectes platessa]